MWGSFSYLPPPWIELAGVLVERVVEVDRPEVHEHAPPLGDEMSLHLHIPDRLAHDPDDDVPQSQCLRYHLHMYPQQKIVSFTLRHCC